MIGLTRGITEQFIAKQYQYGTDRLQYIREGANAKILPILEANSIPVDDFLLVLTGSDGRKENHSRASSIEMIAYFKEEREKKIINDVINQIGEVFQGYNRLSLSKVVYGNNFVVVEPKNFNLISDFEDHHRDYSVFFPSRFMDSEMIFGLNNTYEQIAQIFKKDVKTKNASEIERFKGRVKYAQDISLIGRRDFRGSMLEHYNIERGEIYYEKNRDIERGIKMGPLRYLQYKLSLLIVQLLRKDRINHQDLIDIEGFIASKIDFLRNYVIGGWDESTLRDLKTIYYTFLKIHHICQKEYKKENKVYIYPLDKDDVVSLQAMLSVLHHILSNTKVR